MAADKALYKGHAIAAVAAINIHVAEEALSLIDVQYEELEPVLTVQQAMPSTAPLLHPELLTEEMGEKTKTKSNIDLHHYPPEPILTQAITNKKPVIYIWTL